MFFKQLSMEQRHLCLDFLNLLSLLTFGLHEILTLPNETEIITRGWKESHAMSILLITYVISINEVPDLFYIL